MKRIAALMAMGIIVLATGCSPTPKTNSASPAKHSEQHDCSNQDTAPSNKKKNSSGQTGMDAYKSSDSKKSSGTSGKNAKGTSSKGSQKSSSKKSDSKNNSTKNSGKDKKSDQNKKKP